MFKDGFSIANFVEMNFPTGTHIVASELLLNRPEIPRAFAEVNFPTRISQIVDSEVLQDQPENPRGFVEINFPAGISQIVDSELLQVQPEMPQETPVAR